MQAMLNVAVRAARRAGDYIVRRYDNLPRLHVHAKGRNDFVSEVDRTAEDMILKTIRKAYPAHAYLAEESGARGHGPYRWIVDPLDGTTNFLHGCPQFAVSIALEHKRRIIHGVVYDPLLQEIFTASRGNGAYLNDRRIRASGTEHLRDALLGTGFPFRELERLSEYLPLFERMCSSCAGVRRFGAAALDLAYVACGRLDGFWEFDLHPWDIAAGILLIEEAGGIVTGLRGRENPLRNGNVLAGNPAVHRQMRRLIGRKDDTRPNANERGSK